MKLAGIFAASLLMLSALAFADKPAASSVMSDAQMRAKREQKNIFVMFDASW